MSDSWHRWNLMYLTLVLHGVSIDHPFHHYYPDPRIHLYVCVSVNPLITKDLIKHTIHRLTHYTQNTLDNRLSTG